MGDRLAWAVRLLRTGRVVRGVGFLRVLTSINRGLASLRATAAQRGVGYVITATALVMAVGSAGMAFFESGPSGDGTPDSGAGSSAMADYGDAFWWAF